MEKAITWGTPMIYVATPTGTCGPVHIGYVLKLKEKGKVNDNCFIIFSQYGKATAGLHEGYRFCENLHGYETLIEGSPLQLRKLELHFDTVRKLELKDITAEFIFDLEKRNRHQLLTELGVSRESEIWKLTVTEWHSFKDPDYKDILNRINELIAAA